MQHPAAKMLVLASKMQEAESGDGTNLVVVLAGELLLLAEDLLKNGLHCSEVIAGYTAAAEKAYEVLDGLVKLTPPPTVFHDPAELAKGIEMDAMAYGMGCSCLQARRTPHATRAAAHSHAPRLASPSLR